MITSKRKKSTYVHRTEATARVEAILQARRNAQRTHERLPQVTSLGVAATLRPRDRRVRGKLATALLVLCCAAFLVEAGWSAHGGGPDLGGA